MQDKSKEEKFLSIFDDTKNKNNNETLQLKNNLSDLNFNCSGCGLCKNICPVGAISLQKNEKGFIYPVIDTNKCVKCGVCVKNCSQLRNYEKLKFENGIYALKRKDNYKGRFSSTGIFGSIAKKVLSEKGAVFGVKYNSEKSYFIKVENKKDLEKIEGSKYFQVDVSNIYKEIEICLNKNQKVLVGATPCQIAGLRRKFRFNSNLILMQVLCHGVPSQDIFNKISLERFGEIPRNVNFRAEGKNFFEYNEEYTLSNKLLSFVNKEDPYIKLFLSDIALNDCCYNCKYAGSQTGADIIVGDCWGIKQINEEFYSDKGVSILTFNTQVGVSIFNSIKENYDIYKIPKNKYKYCNENLFKCIVDNKKMFEQHKFFKDIKNIKCIDLIKENEEKNKPKMTFMKKLKRKIKKILKLN